MHTKYRKDSYRMHSTITHCGTGHRRCGTSHTRVKEDTALSGICRSSDNHVTNISSFWWWRHDYIIRHSRDMIGSWSETNQYHDHGAASVDGKYGRVQQLIWLVIWHWWSPTAVGKCGAAVMTHHRPQENRRLLTTRKDGQTKRSKLRAKQP